MRIPIIDGWRGFFLLFMMIIHLNLELGTVIGKLNHHYFGFVEDAQGFVFISGFVVGLVYTRILLKNSYGEMRSAIWRRIFTIWTHQAGLIFIFLFLAIILSFNNIYPTVLYHYASEPIYFTIASLSLVAASKHMGILPMYIYFMVLTPLILSSFSRGYAPAVFVTSIFLWTFGQTGFLDLLSQSARDIFSAQGKDIKFGIFFNIFSWQTIYIAGLWLGYLQSQNKLSLDFLKAPAYKVAALTAVLFILYFGLLDRAVHWFWISEAFSASFKMQEVRADFSTIHVINFAVDLFVVTWLIYAGQSSGIKVIEWLSRRVYWIFTRPALVLLGKHSLHVFSFHLVVVYLVAIIYDSGPPDQLTGSIILILGVISLYIPAWYNEKNSNKKRALQKLSVPPGQG